MSTPTPGDWLVEEARAAADLDALLAIERASFDNPWTRDMFKWEMENAPVSRIYLLRDRTRQALAFCSVWMVAGELHINNLAVRPDRRGQGVGRTMLTAVLGRAAAEGCRTATLEVRRSNTAARGLYEAFGFRLAGVRPGYYTRPDEDALILGKVGLAAP